MTRAIRVSPVLVAFSLLLFFAEANNQQKD